MAGEDEAGLKPPTEPAPTQTQTESEPAAPAEEPMAPKPGFGERGRMRRRARFLRKARELAYRDLGGLVYDLHRFGQRNDPVVLAKLSTLGHIDAELRALETALHEIKPVTVLHEVGIAACPRCAAIHGNEDRFCPGCGLAFAAGADRPLSTAPVTGSAPATAATAQPPATSQSAQAPAPTAAPAAAPAAARPAGEPLTTIERPPAPAVKPTAAPVAARPATPAADSAGKRDSDGNGKPDPEQEPTQILRPPPGGP